jgi:glycine/D-amino acid oxidase-like deaminating enzyme
MAPTAIVIGAGIFGVTGALALRQRGHVVHLLDPGPLPHPLAASTDISKVIRLDYGPDHDYLVAMEAALAGWRAWNAEWPEPLFHETGVLFLARAPLAPGGFEHESFQRLIERGHQPQRLDADAIARCFPAWQAGAYVDGYFNPEGGFAESGKVAGRLLAMAEAAGVQLHAGQACAGLLAAGGRICGVTTRAGERFEGDAVVVAAGAWTRYLLPWTAELFRSPGMPVFHLRPSDPGLFAAERFPPFCADISHTGYYGFCLHPHEGVVKVANHGEGRQMAPEAPERAVTEAETGRLRDFLRGSLPALAEAPATYTRVCLYCDTWDGHLWIAPDPERPGLVLATGGSGHAFKFAPIMGDWIADAVEARPNALLAKFRWRPEVRPPRTEEAARYLAGDWAD